MNHWRVATEALATASVITVIGFFTIFHQFSDRVPARTYIGNFPIGGMLMSDVSGALRAYEQDVMASRITIRLRGKEVTHSLTEMGAVLQQDAMVEEIRGLRGNTLPLRRIQVSPMVVSGTRATQLMIERDFASVIAPPRNPGILVSHDYTVSVVPGVPGERIDILSLNRDVSDAVTVLPYKNVIASTIRALPQEDSNQAHALQIYIQNLFATGLQLTAGDRQFVMPKEAIAPMLEFQTVSAGDIALNEKLLRMFIEREIAPKIHRDSINARFEIRDGRVSQFAMPQDGEDVDIDESIRAIETILFGHKNSAEIVLMHQAPIVRDVESTQSRGIVSMLARGETDFRGSPKNRTHNIEVGTAKYHGLLIAPGVEFSFNQFLGPVNGDTGFKPELVIKNNVTTAEFGGGLCQVSTTLFRAAVQAGMKITVRHNHSYAVRYYGTPGFDATIYPPYTDFRFLNNTPGYLLIQTKIDGTHLSFELWGTPDGREVEIDGPHPYDKRPDGAVKAILKQTVRKDGQTLIEDTFSSNYKSPKLFPHI